MFRRSELTPSQRRYTDNKYTEEKMQSFPHLCHSCRNSEAPRRPLAIECMNILCGYYLIHYLMLKRNELSSLQKSWRNFKSILQSVRSQFEKAPYCVTPNTGHSRKDRNSESVTISSYQVLSGRKGGIGGSRALLGQWIHLIRHCGHIDMSFRIC